MSIRIKSVLIPRFENSLYSASAVYKIRFHEDVKGMKAEINGGDGNRLSGAFDRVRVDCLCYSGMGIYEK
jgi:hypothetical protein